MKKIITLVFILTAFLAKAQSEKAIVELSKKKFQWMINLQYDSLEAALDDRLMFIHSNGWSENKREFINDIKSGKLRYIDIEIAESNARVYINTAIVTGKGKFSVKLDGNDLLINLFYTEVWILKNDRWLLASRHANRMQ